MAGVITHLVVADEMLKSLPEGTINQKGLFYLGSFAPDAVHARENYIRAYKKHSHFRDDILDSDFELEENYEIYKKRLIDFIIRHQDYNDPLIDLYRGYVVHILTDELFMLSVRNEFSKSVKEIGIEQSNPLFYETIVTDLHRNDMLLVNQYDRMKDIKMILEQAVVYPVEDYISEQELSISIEWLLQQHFYTPMESLQPVYISAQRMQEFIKYSTGEIINRLSGVGVLPKML
ncbi:MAG: zinc dependent phospholipase C family protein [Mobilitalea sp.]